MDLLNTFLIFNITATIAALTAFFMMRENVAVAWHNSKASAGRFNVVGAAGAATSMVLLSSVAVLFR